MAAIIFCEAYLFMRVWFSKTSLMLLQKSPCLAYCSAGTYLFRTRVTPGG